MQQTLMEQKPALSEAAMQAEIFQFYWNNYPETRRRIFHCPNGGSRNKIEAVQLRAQGVVSGIPDLLCIGLNGFFAIELKLPSGIVSPEQKAVHEVWNKSGQRVYVCWSKQEAMEVINKEFGI